MTRLFRSGADVPEPLASGYNAKLIPKSGCDDLPSPILNTQNLVKRDARQIFEYLIHKVESMLANQRVDEDLFAYNILYLEGEIYLIGFSQTIDPEVNRNASAIFKRDI